MAADGNGNIYIADGVNHRIRKITSTGLVTTIAGSGITVIPDGENEAVGTFADGTGIEASFNFPADVAVDASGFLYVSDQENHRIRKISPAGVVTTIAGSGTPGFADGIGSLASFNRPRGLTVDANGNIYVCDLGNSRIRKITPSGVVTTLAGSGTLPFADGFGAEAGFSSPSDIALGPDNFLYVTDSYNYRIRRISLSGNVTTFAGNGMAGFVNGPAADAAFNQPYGINVDLNGNVYVAEFSNHVIRKITPQGIVSTFAGSTRGYLDGFSLEARFLYPLGILAHPSGSFFVTDGNNNIRKITEGVICTTPPTPTVSHEGSLSFCPGGYVTLTSSASSGNVWSNGATEQTIEVDEPGTYSVVVTSSGCTSNVSNAINIAQNIIHIPTVSNVTGSTSLCSSTGSIQLNASSISGGNFLWSNGVRGTSVFITAPGTYSVRNISFSGCTSQSSTPITIINGLSNTPIITASGPTTICQGNIVTLTSSSATNNFWSNGATTQSITVSSSGTFTVYTLGSLPSGSACTSMISSPVAVTFQNCAQEFIIPGNFNHANSWRTGAIPSSGTDIVVNAIMTVTTNTTIGSVIIQTGGKIIIPSGITLTLTGNLTNNGDIVGAGTLKLSGSANQNFGGRNIENLYIDNGSTAYLNAPISITGSLRLGNNQSFDLNRFQLRLASGSSNTAFLAPVPSTATILNSSTFTVSRWLDPNNVRTTALARGNYYLLGPVVQNKTVDIWNAVSPYGPETFNQATSTGSRFHFYNTATNNWIKPLRNTQPLAAGVGVQVWFGASGFFNGGRTTWSVSGSPVIGNFNIPLTNGVTGFNLISNPYPSTIDWDSPSWNKTGIANAIYIYDWKNLRYNTYINGIGTNGGSRYLPTAQGFFVNTTSVSAVLTATENIKVTNQVALQRTESTVNGLIRLAINNNGVNDEMVIANRTLANLAFEADQDAQKMMNPTTNIFVSGSVNQSIASMNLNGVNSVPFIILSSTTGFVTLNTTEMNGLEGYTFNLFNEQTGELLPYTGTETYTFNVISNQPYHMQLRVGSVTGIETFKAKVFEVFPNPASDKVTIKTTGTGTLEILNTLGQIIITQPAIATNEINVSKLAKGIYTIKFNGTSQKLVVR